MKLDVFLQAGLEYTFSTCGTGSSDTYLRLHSNGGQVAYNDDGCGSGTRSKIVFTPSTSGTYVLSMGCYSSYSCSGPVIVTPGDDGSCTGTLGGGGGGGGGCEPTCTGDLCGQADGCGGTCPDTDLYSCGMCGNPGPDCSGDQCGQADGCGGTCPATDIDTCGMCGNPACGSGEDLYEPNLSASSGSYLSFTFEATNPTISISGGTGDADLYVRLGDWPSTYTYDCRPYSGGNDETCNLTGSGTFYIWVRAYSSYSGVTLTGTSN